MLEAVCLGKAHRLAAAAREQLRALAHVGTLPPGYLQYVDTACQRAAAMPVSQKPMTGPAGPLPTGSSHIGSSSARSMRRFASAGTRSGSRGIALTKARRCVHENGLPWLHRPRAGLDRRRRAGREVLKVPHMDLRAASGATG